MDLSLDLNPASASFGDLLIIDGDVVPTSDVDPRGTHPVLQDIFQRLRTFLGEWYLDTSNGVPWLQQIFVKGVKQSTIDSIIQGVILSAPGVVMLSSYALVLDRTTRAGTLAFAAITSTGTINYSLPIGAVTA